MKTHKIKLREEFCEDVYFGKKTFEIRKNDRGYQVGDCVMFLPVDNDGKPVKHSIDGKRYKITYIIEGWGLQDGYVAFAIEGMPFWKWSEQE